MSGKIFVGAIVMISVIFGAIVYYTQMHAYYEEVPASQAAVYLTPVGGGTPEVIPVDDLKAIDANSSPIRYRACFKTHLSLPMLTETYQPYEGAAPRNAPGWFDCFDAQALGAQIEAGKALVFTGQRNVEYGIDRVIAITEDGQGYVWHEVNDCGDKAYDGTPKGKDCPPKPTK